MSGRFAPSPTGTLHLGNLRTALLASLAARSTGLDFIIRMEDLDRVQAAPEHEATQLADLAVQGKAPKLGIRVEVERVFFHCAKAIKRSRLWDPAAQVPRDAFPTPGEVIRDQRRPQDSAEALDALVIEDQKNNLY